MLLLNIYLLLHMLLNSFVLISSNTNNILSTFNYPSYDEIYLYLKQLEETYSDCVELENIGISNENRNITCIKIKSRNKRKSPAIFIDAGIHAREWVSPVTAIYFINQILQNEQHAYLRQNIDWYIIPLLNPDGYEYSRLKDTTWRKNVNNNTFCNGVDLNRNFDFQWEKEKKCSDVYPGQEPNSEPEVQAFINFVLSHKNIRLYLTLHSYGSLILYPWAYTNNKIFNHEEHREIAKEMAAAMHSVREHDYLYGQPGELLYNAAGSSMDWTIGVAKIPLAFAIELGTNKSNFFPSATERKYLLKEAFEGLKVIHKYIQNVWYVRLRRYFRHKNKYLT